MTFNEFLAFGFMTFLFAYLLTVVFAGILRMFSFTFDDEYQLKVDFKNE